MSSLKNKKIMTVEQEATLTTEKNKNSNPFLDDEENKNSPLPSTESPCEDYKDDIEIINGLNNGIIVVKSDSDEDDKTVSLNENDFGNDEPEEKNEKKPLTKEDLKKALIDMQKKEQEDKLKIKQQEKEEKERKKNLDKKLKEDLKEIDNELFLKQVVEFEKKWFMVSNDISFWTIDKVPHDVFDKDRKKFITRLSEEPRRYLKLDLAERLGCSTEEVYLGHRFNFKKWLSLTEKNNEVKCIYMNPFHDTGFNETTTEEGIKIKRYNVFTGFKYKRNYEQITEEEQKMIDKMLGLIDDVVGGDENIGKDCVEYFLNWCASIYQNPHLKTKTCIIIHGDQGTGKDLIIDEGIGSLLGSSYAVCNNPEKDMLGDFNSILSGKILLKGEEIDINNTSKGMQKFKSWITTNDTITIEDKHKTIRAEKSYHNFVGTSNKTIPIFPEDSDRRFMVFKSKNVIRSYEDWKPYWKTFESHEFKIAWSKYLSQYKIPVEWSPKDRPLTDSYKYIKLATAPSHAIAFNKLCNDMKNEDIKYYRCEDYLDEKDYIVFKPERFLKCVNDTLSKLSGYGNSRKSQYNNTNFGKILIDEYKCVQVKKDERKNNGISYFIKDKNKFIVFVKDKMIQHLKNKGWYLDYHDGETDMKDTDAVDKQEEKKKIKFKKKAVNSN